MNAMHSIFTPFFYFNLWFKAENDITGTIPTELGNLNELVRLDLCK